MVRPQRSEGVCIALPIWGVRPEFEKTISENWQNFLTIANEILICTDLTSLCNIERIIQSLPLPDASNNCRVAIVNCGTGVTKAALLNNAAKYSSKEILFFCDCDVIVPLNTLREMCRRAEEGFIAYIARVFRTESEQLSQLTIKSHVHSIRDLVEITDVSGNVVIVEKTALYPSISARGGPGIVCMRADFFSLIGGYNEIFSNYGWEDIDLLLRAGLLAGLVTIAVGEAYEIGLPIKFAEQNERLLSESKNYVLARANYCLGILEGTLANVNSRECELHWVINDVGAISQ